MKPTHLLLALCLPLSSCLNASGTNWKITAVGNDADSLEVNESGLKIVKLDQTKGLTVLGKLATTSWRSYLVAAGIKYISGLYYDQQGRVLSADTTVKLEQLRNAKSAADQAAALETLKVTTAAAPVVTP